MEQTIFLKHTCWDVIKKTSDALRLNIFITNMQGQIVLMPDIVRYGGQILTDPSLGFDFISQTPEILHRPGKPYGLFREINCHYGLKMFSAPIRKNGHDIDGYIVIGPCILNRRLEPPEYEQMASRSKADYHKVWQEINSIRIVSNVQMNTVLNLVDDLVKINIELACLREELEKNRESRDHVSSQINDFLKVITGMSDAEGASVMTIDPDRENLTIDNVYGQEQSLIGRKIRLGEGIAGISAQANSAFTITDQKNTDNRIAHLLKRNEIKQAIVMPLVKNGCVQGILNIHTHRPESNLKDNIEYLRLASDYLAKILP